MNWEDLKQEGSAHYKNGGIEPIDLYRSSGMLRVFCLCNIIKYAYRGSKSDMDMLKRDLNKIIHYARYLLADLEDRCKQKPIASSSHAPTF